MHAHAQAGTDAGAHTGMEDAGAHTVMEDAHRLEISKIVFCGSRLMWCFAEGDSWEGT